MAMSYQFCSVSVDELQEQFVRDGMDFPSAAKKAKEAFPQRVSDLIDQDWKVIVGDSTKVYLRKRK